MIQDGFKKVLKNDPCPFENCQFSQVCNHIHCMRKKCCYVLHSSGQLASHKRKHERFEIDELPQPAKKPKNEESDDSSEKDLFSILSLIRTKTVESKPEEPLNLSKSEPKNVESSIKDEPSSVIPKEVVVNSTPKSNGQAVSTIENFFNRKRGRPPKNRFVEVYGVSIIKDYLYSLWYHIIN